MIRTVLIAAALLSTPALAKDTARSAFNDTTLKFQIERLGREPMLITSGAISELPETKDSAVMNVHRDTQYDSNSNHFLGVVREGIAVSLSNTQNTSATVNVVLDQLKDVRNYTTQQGSQTTQMNSNRTQLVFTVQPGKQEQRVQINRKPYKITTIYTPGDSAAPGVVAAGKEADKQAVQANQEAVILPERTPEYRKVLDRKQQETSDEYRHP